MNFPIFWEVFFAAKKEYFFIFTSKHFLYVR